MSHSHVVEEESEDEDDDDDTPATLAVQGIRHQGSVNRIKVRINHIQIRLRALNVLA